MLNNKELHTNRALILRKIGKYVREVSIVVLGVAITLSVTVWLNNRNEKRDMGLYLNAIKIELEENIKIMDMAIDFLQVEAAYTTYLNSHDIQSYNEDTLEYYVHTTCYYLNKFPLKTNAFEMLKSSHIMRLLDDKELLLSLWNVYIDIDMLNTNFEWYFNTKWGHMEKDLSLIRNGMISFETAPMYNFYIIALTTSGLKDWKAALNDTNETITKLEKRK